MPRLSHLVRELGDKRQYQQATRRGNSKTNRQQLRQSKLHISEVVQTRSKHPTAQLGRVFSLNRFIKSQSILACDIRQICTVQPRTTEKSTKTMSDDNAKWEPAKPASSSWDEARIIPADGWERMKKGFTPQDMDDRWVILHLEKEGEESVVFARSWTGYTLGKITVEPAGDDGKSRRITKFTWETDKERWNVEDPETEARALVVRFSKGVFQVDLADEPDSE